MTGLAAGDETGLRVASWPHWYAPNPYLPLLYAALEEHGIEHVPGVELDLRRFRGEDRVADCVHLHWAYPLWREAGGRWTPRNRKIDGALGRIQTIRDAGVPLVWTVHNIAPHDGLQPGEEQAYRRLHEMADLRVFHSRSARDEASERFGDRGGDTIIQHHGNWDGAVQPPGDTLAILEREHLPVGARILLCVGQIREYKGFDRAIDALEELNAVEAGAHHLVIAGRPVGPYESRLRRRARGVAGLTLLLEELDDQRLADLFGVADAVLLPYRSVTGSGVLLHALTVGRGVVASDLPFFREVLTEGSGAGELVGPDESLSAGVRRYFAVDRATRDRAARALAEKFAWPVVVEPLAAWLRQSVRPSTRPSSPGGRGGSPSAT